MRQDPRCPHCGEKVSATAVWCMHCGRDFEAPVEAGSGRAVRDSRNSGTAESGPAAPASPEEIGSLDDLLAVLDRSEESRRGLVVAIAGATWFLATAATGVTGGFALLVAAAFGYYLWQLDDPATILLRGVYGAALVILSLLVFLVVSTGRGILRTIVDPWALLVVLLLVAGGRWLSARLGARTAGR